MSEITIITPTYKAEPQVLTRCFDSVQRQSFTDFTQLVCSDDVCEELTRHMVETRNDSRIRYSALGEHVGGHANELRRRVLKQVSTPYVMFLDDDNFIFPTYIEKMLNALMAHPSAGFAICEILHYGPLIDELGTPPVVLKGETKRRYIDTLQIVVKTAVMQQIGWIGDSYISDGITYEALGKCCNHVRVPEVLCVHS